jgi:hypothetical protein
VAIQAESWLDSSLGHDLPFHLAGVYQPYSVNHLAGSSVYLWGLFGGLQLWSPEGLGKVRLFLGLDVGAVYKRLSLANAPSGSTSNAALSFAGQVVPGVDVPLFSKLGAVVELPMIVVFQKDSLAIWNGSFSLRWML